MLDFLPMPDTVEIINTTGIDDYGRPIKGTSDPVACRIQHNSARESIAVAGGEEIVFSATILLRGVPAITYDSLIKYTDSFNGVQEVAPLSLQVKRDLFGKPLMVKVVV